MNKKRGNDIDALPVALRGKPRGRGLALLAVGLLGLATGVLGGPLIAEQLGIRTATLAVSSETPTTGAITDVAIPQHTETATPPPTLESAEAKDPGAAILSMSTGGRAQLYSYSLEALEPRLLFEGTSDDMQPALSPNQSQLAFASNNAGHWDLYVLNFISGETTQISDDLAYHGAPSWSPDAAWLAYEQYSNDNLDIYIRPIDGSVEPIRISTDLGLDFAPAWSPNGQEIAFVSDRSGRYQIWIVDLEASGGQRFRAAAPNSSSEQADPSWSPDGGYLAWSAYLDGLWRIYVLDTDAPEAGAQEVGSGEQPVFDADGEQILAIVRRPQQSYLTAYTLEGGLALAPIALDGEVEGLAWSGMTPTNTLSAAINPFGKEATNIEPGQGELAELAGVVAPYPELNAEAIASFEALQERAADHLGWDALSNLEHAFVPLTYPMAPARQQDWLYTGRAFALQAGLISAGWMQVVREDFGGETYWRVFLKTAAQDGSQGQPMRTAAWDFAARGGDYQAGGQAIDAAAGYWIDFTALSADFGWERLPAQTAWRSFFEGSLFNEFAFRQGLQWGEAMLQLYPAEAVSTPEPESTP
ncbi:MAG: hypothetical protein DWG76_06370 [Chloroflexi bacterium]|nr:hypothetical protein [Chloroflexota bacterium]MQC27053.1 hypothetical protein [Chloroflexota bacterium]